MGLPVKVYNQGMKIRAGTLQYFAECLVAYFSREPKDEQERVQIERERTRLRNKLLQMAGVEPELKPLPELPPGKARVVSF